MIFFFIFFLKKIDDQNEHYSYFDLLLSGQIPLYEKLLMQQEQGNQIEENINTEVYQSHLFRGIILSNLFIFLPSLCILIFILFKNRCKPDETSSKERNLSNNDESKQVGIEPPKKCFYSLSLTEFTIFQPHKCHISYNYKLPIADYLESSMSTQNIFIPNFPEYNHHKTCQLENIDERYKKFFDSLQISERSTLSDDFGWY